VGIKGQTWKGIPHACPGVPGTFKGVPALQRRDPLIKWRRREVRARPETPYGSQRDWLIPHQHMTGPSYVGERQSLLL
jgi:hypothetical protein